MSVFAPIPFPNTAYFLHMLNEPPVEICASLRWKKQDVFNRYLILTDKGEHRLTIPVEKPAYDARLQEVRISYREAWRQQHLRAITSAYKASPYFEYFEQDLVALFSGEEEFLAAFALKSLTFCLSSLKNIRHTNSNPYFTVAGEDCWQKIDIITLRKLLAEPLPDNMAYRQVFGRKFVTTTSVLDAIFCAGPRGILIPPFGT